MIKRTYGGNASGSVLRIAIGILLLAILLLVSSASATQTTVSVIATKAWTDTGIDIPIGVHVDITASGKIKIAGSDPGKNPDGTTFDYETPSISCPLSVPNPNAQCWSLIGRIGTTGTMFSVGYGTNFTAATTGRLFLGVNDNIFGDNSGAWTAVVSVTSPTPTPTPTFNISGFKINNSNSSGIQGWNITLTNSTMQKSMLTEADGSYKFANLVNGTYTVIEEMKTGWTNISPISQQVTIIGADISNINFTNVAKLPIILIPGIMGSKLAVTGSQAINQIQKEKLNVDGNCVQDFGNWTHAQGDLIWVDENLLHLVDIYQKISKPCSNYLDVLQFNSQGQPLYPQVSLNDEIVDETYKSAREYLKNEGYTEGKDLFIFPYDWRKDINSEIGSLDNLVNTIKQSTGADKVDILAHSMGGLVARKYISDQNRATNIRTLVELGTPHAGSPKALAQLLYNTCPFTKWLFFCIPNGQEAHKIVQNFPGVFELLPSQFYFQLYPTPNYYPFSDERNIDNDQSTDGPLTYDKTKTLLSHLGKNMALFDNAQDFHTGIDWTNTDTVNGVQTYLIAGSGQATIGQIHDYRGFRTNWNRVKFPFGPITQDADSINGDDTVPIRSATLSQQETSQSNVFYAKQNHNNLLKDDSLKMAVRLLEGNTSYSDLTVQKTPYNFNGKVIGIYSPAVLDAYDDQNHHTGLTTDGTIEVNIPGSFYDELGEAKFIYLPEGGNYRLTTNATGEGNFDLKIKTYTDSDLTEEQLYLDVPQTTQTTTSLSLDTSSPILKVDTNNDGTVDKELSPTSTLTGGSIADTTTPTTQVQLAGTQGTNGWYTSNVAVTLTAQDDNAGVLKTLYYFDGEGTIHMYTEPVSLTTEGTTKVWYFSVDKAGNTEQPKSLEVKIDKTAPKITINTPANGNEYLLNQHVLADWSSADLISGIASATGTNPNGEAIATASVGANTFSINADDNAGNTNTVMVTYYVRYKYSGILQPINADNSSIFKLGSTIPVKFQLIDSNGNYVTNAVAKIYMAKISNGIIGKEMEANSTSKATTGNIFRYDITNNQYIFNLGTKDLSTGTWQIRIELDDTTSKIVEIGLK